MPRRPLLPWYNKDIQAAKRHRMYCERLWIRTGLCIRYEMFRLKISLPLPNQNITINKIKASKGNQRTIFIDVNKVLHNGQTVLPNIINSDKDITHCFNNFFYQKILNIPNGFLSSALSQGNPLVEEFCMSKMETFEPFTKTDIRPLLKGHPMLSVQLTLCQHGL